MVKRHPQSVPGDFYVEDGYCLACGVPEFIAPDLVAHTGEPYWHCYWKKQPQTSDELDRAIEILHTQELACHHYGGTDPAIIERLPPQCGEVISAPRPLKPLKTWNLADGPDVHFALLSRSNFIERILGRVLAGLSRGVKP